MLINKPEVNIVALKKDGNFTWMICDKDMWVMSVDVLINIYRESGWNLDFSYLPEVKNGVHSITKENFELYLSIYQNQYEILSQEMLKARIEETCLKGRDILPDLLVDFDHQTFYSQYTELTRYERYVPDGWIGSLEPFWNHIPQEEIYWIEKEGKYYVK